MVPYVRMSFFKHFKDGIKYIEGRNDTLIENYDRSIEDSFYKVFSGAYKYALDMTEKELMQAVQGMYHNLK